MRGGIEDMLNKGQEGQPAKSWDEIQEYTLAKLQDAVEGENPEYQFDNDEVKQRVMEKVEGNIENAVKSIERTMEELEEKRGRRPGDAVKRMHKINLAMGMKGIELFLRRSETNVTEGAVGE